MALELKITFDSFDELARFAAQVTGIGALPTVKTTPEQPELPLGDMTFASITPKAGEVAAKRRGRPAKPVVKVDEAELAAPTLPLSPPREPAPVVMDAVPASDPAPESEAYKPAETTLEVSLVTLEQARAALAKVNEKHGLEKAFDLVKSFGVQRVSEIEGARLAELVAKCEAAIKE